MKRKELYNFIREEIISELTESGTYAGLKGIPQLTKDPDYAKLDPNTKINLKADLTKGKSVTLEEDELEEARKANNLKVDSQEKFTAAKDLYEGSWIANLLNFIAEAGEEGISQKDLAKKLGKKSSANINPAIQELKMVKAITTTRIKGDTLPKVTDSEEEEIIAVAGGEEEEEEDTFYKIDKEFDSPEAEEEPKMADIKAAEKINSKDYAKILSPEEEEKYTKIRKGIEAKVVKLSKLSKDKRTSSDDMKVLKQLIAREDVKKLFKDKGVNLKSIVADIIT